MSLDESQDREDDDDEANTEDTGKCDLASCCGPKLGKDAEGQTHD